MAHDGHVGRAMVGAQAREIVSEDDVENPVQPVLDAPMAAHDATECFGIQLGGTQIISCLLLDFAVAFGLALDHADHGDAGEGRAVAGAGAREKLT